MRMKKLKINVMFTIIYSPDYNLNIYFIMCIYCNLERDINEQIFKILIKKDYLRNIVVVFQFVTYLLNPFQSKLYSLNS
jgi:hypothetical protein